MWNRSSRCSDNLLNNAIKFSPDHSTIIIETTEKIEKDFVSVKDHGIGIPKESLSKIWERFYKTDISRGKGTRKVPVLVCLL